MSRAEGDRPAGRPSAPSQNRERLIDAARSCFVKQEYNKVSVRQIAKDAGVDPGLIRYYFGSKDKLFSAVIRETTQPIVNEFKQLQQISEFEGLTDLMACYYQVMLKHPDFPLLVFRLASLPELHPEHQLLKQNLLQEMQSGMAESIANKQLLREGVDPKFAMFSVMSMTIFPFIMPTMFRQQHGIELDAQTLERLLEHNIALLKHGIMRKTDHA